MAAVKASGILVVRLEVLAAVHADPEWKKRLDQAKSTDEIKRVFVEFCRVKGIEIVQFGVAG